MSADACEKIARRFHRIRQDHQNEPGAFMAAFIMEAVALSRWLGMDTAAFLETFAKTFAVVNASAVEGYAQPTIIGRKGAS